MSIYNFNSLPGKLIQNSCNVETAIIVCIPSYDEDNLLGSVESLLQCYLNVSKFEILVLINEPLNAPKSVKSTNLKSYQQIMEIRKVATSPAAIYPIYIKNIPDKKAGVGLARRMLMDEAAKRLTTANNAVRVIASFDADSFCDSNYLEELRTYFAAPDARWAASIYYEHPFRNYPSDEKSRAIVLYELHLRYYINMQRWCGLPYGYQTLGSSMAVEAGAYSRMGGMNTRQAGEDFYFLHKFIKIDQCGEINSTRVIPSGRTSSRVPFGTGKAVSKILESDGEQLSYSPTAFEMLMKFIEIIPSLYRVSDDSKMLLQLNELKDPLQTFLDHIGAEARLLEIKKNTASERNFIKRFYQWFDAFLLMKYLHFVRDKGFPDVPVIEASRSLFDMMGMGDKDLGGEEMLLALRKIDRNSNYSHSSAKQLE